MVLGGDIQTSSPSPLPASEVKEKTTTYLELLPHSCLHVSQTASTLMCVQTGGSVIPTDDHVFPIKTILALSHAVPVQHQSIHRDWRITAICGGLWGEKKQPSQTKYLKNAQTTMCRWLILRICTRRMKIVWLCNGTNWTENETHSSPAFLC